MRSAFKSLLWKEFRQAAPTSALILAGIVGWLVFLYTRMGEWSSGHILGFGFLPLYFLPFWVLIRGYEGFRREWAGQHQHLLLMLPVPSWWVTAAKLLVAWVECTLYGLTVALGLFVLEGPLKNPAFTPDGLNVTPERLEAIRSIIFKDFLRLLPLALLAIAIAIVLAQVSWAVAQLFRRGQGVVANVAFLLGCWFMLRIGYLASLALGWLPSIRLLEFPEMAMSSEGGMTWVSTVGIWIHPAPIVGVAAAGALFFWLTSWLLERLLEV